MPGAGITVSSHIASGENFIRNHSAPCGGPESLSPLEAGESFVKGPLHATKTNLLPGLQAGNLLLYLTTSHRECEGGKLH